MPCPGGHELYETKTMGHTCTPDNRCQYCCAGCRGYDAKRRGPLSGWEPGQLVRLMTDNHERVELEKLQFVRDGYEVWQGTIGGVLLVTFASTDAELIFA